MKKISVGILTYNHEQFVAKCLTSVLQSTYPNLEIIISDDASMDGTAEVVRKIVDSTPTSHRVIFNENKNNLGLAAHFNLVFRDMAKGDVLVTLGGDDMIKEDYFESAMLNFDKNPDIVMVDFNAVKINQHDEILGVASKLNFDTHTFDINDYLSLKSIQTFAPGRMIRKEIVADFPPIAKDCPTEDSVLVLRALLSGKLLRINKNVIFYRKHSNNLSSETNLHKMSFNAIIRQYLKDSIFFFENNNAGTSKEIAVLRRVVLESKRRDVIYSKSNIFKKKLQLILLTFLFRRGLI